jgi:hypothetical protein
MADTNVPTLDFVETAGNALGVSLALATKVAEEGVKVASLAPQRADLLIQAGLITPQEKQAAVEQLGDHAGALDVVGNLIAILGETKTAYEQKLAAKGNGEGAPDTADQPMGQVKRADAGDDVMQGGYVGRRAGVGEKRASDLALIRGLGLQSRS